MIDETIGRHVANEERLLAVLTPAEQETLNTLLKKLMTGLWSMNRAVRPFSLGRSRLIRKGTGQAPENCRLVRSRVT